MDSILKNYDNLWMAFIRPFR